MRAKLLYFVISLFLAFGPLVKVAYSQEFVISDNGSSSENQIQLQTVNSSIVGKFNSSDIENNITITASTGNNKVSENNGDTSIQTGEISVKVSVENMANTTLVEEQPCCDPQPSAEVLANGSESQNNITINQSFASSVSQTNNADPIINDINITANTGGNVANENVGNVTIKTGDIFLDFIIQNKPINFGGIFNFEVKAKEQPGEEKAKKEKEKQKEEEQIEEEEAEEEEEGEGEEAEEGEEILGLGPTSGPGSSPLYFYLGLGLILIGGRIIAKEVAAN